ncbi:MarR family transcriptional regulator [Streptomyces niveiscabiei]|uniref:MarR family transcriptional regulator n=1 Tax=Streptomyces niveiscabiei TaxID=164115 RepID=UPI0029BC7E09|nr:MarR family transcriptional regulator [Streptomyces niveiscabiei]MDX3382443.1 MarR family transcriptional regulator [Streptomyces niveiscabiei]
MTTVDGRIIGLAHHAGRAVAERVLDRHRLGFLDHLALRAALDAEEPFTPDDLAARLTGDLKNDPAVSKEAVTALAARGYLEFFDGPHLLRPTFAGRALFAAASAEIAEASARIYAGLTEEELAVAGRVLEVVTRRANTELEA